MTSAKSGRAAVFALCELSRGTLSWSTHGMKHKTSSILSVLSFDSQSSPRQTDKPTIRMLTLP